MIALDTSVLARLILGDDPAQQSAATRLIEANECSVSWTVLVELFWVLERSAMLSKEQVIGAMRMLSSIEGVTVADTNKLNWAIDRYDQGADFADMAHLAAALPGSTTFATFDRKLARQAGPESPLPVQTLHT